MQDSRGAAVLTCTLLSSRNRGGRSDGGRVGRGGDADGARAHRPLQPGAQATVGLTQGELAVRPHAQAAGGGPLRRHRPHLRRPVLHLGPDEGLEQGV